MPTPAHIRHARVAPVVVMLMLSIGVAGAPGSDDTQATEVDQLRREVAALRAQLAQTQLELRQAMAELKQMREYQETDDAEDQADAWRAEREAVAAERRRLEAERRRLEQARLALRAASRNGGGDIAPARPAEANAAAAPAVVPPAAAAAGAPAGNDQPLWDLDYKIGVIHIGNYAKTYVDPTHGAALVKSYPTIDRRHIMVRGTLQNRSAAPWRYTFEIRIGGREGQVIGRWRHQTEVLGPNELAEFEVKVPVSEVAEIATYQIGNIEADRPVAQPADAAPVKGDPAPAAPPVRERVNR